MTDDGRTALNDIQQNIITTHNNRGRGMMGARSFRLFLPSPFVNGYISRSSFFFFLQLQLRELEPTLSLSLVCAQVRVRTIHTIPTQIPYTERFNLYFMYVSTYLLFRSKQGAENTVAAEFIVRCATVDIWSNPWNQC